MIDRTSISGNCTAQMPSGEFCDAPGMDDMPFPICDGHAIGVYTTLARIIGSLSGPYATQEPPIDNQPATQQKRRLAALEAQSQVYYIRLGDRIKIGYSSNLQQRMISLRVQREDVLATEPGGPQLERERHTTFATERFRRTEEFHPSAALLEHIEGVLTAHGPPKITAYPKVA